MIARKKYALRFSIQPLDFSLETRKDSLNVVRENFSETSGMQRWSKTCSNRSGLSIAPTPDRFGHLHVKILTMLQKIPENLPLKKNPLVLHRNFILKTF